jgi:cell wall-associated NlpC family hydrolase
MGRHVYVIGEDCRGKRHFDCIQFVNWVIGSALGRLITWSETQWRDVGPVSKQPAPTDVAQLEPGDLMVRIAGADDAAGRRRINHMAVVGNNHLLMEASGYGVGVIKNPYQPGSYTDHLRLHNRYLSGAGRAGP